MSDDARAEAPDSLTVRCRCGSVRGAVTGISPASAYRVVCYCDACQAFAERLGSTETLDEHGGTDIIQLSPARLGFTAGLDRLACLRLTPKGPLRWYAGCCDTPIGNTLATGRLPFLGLIHTCLATDGLSIDDVVGPVRLRVMARYARGDLGELDAHERFVLSHVLLILARVLRWRLRGDQRRSPFFDPASGEPISAPVGPIG